MLSYAAAVLEFVRLNFALVRQEKAHTVRVKIITGSLVILENLLPENYRSRYRLEIRMNYHYHYRLGARSHPLHFH